MTMHDADRPLDALDRAILSLGLEEPPSGLRSSILLATAYRPAPPFSFWELALLGALGAAAVWFAALLILGGGSLFVHTVTTIASATISGGGRLRIGPFIVVCTKPGSISVTPIPSLRTSRRTVSDNPRNPNFEAE